MKTVITYGTFDLIHYGHLNLLKRASLLGEKLIVGVSSDKFALQKGKKTVFDLETRMNYIKDLKFVDLVIPEFSMQQKLTDVRKYDINIFCLGDDYKKTFLEMPEHIELVKQGVEVVFLPRTPNISTTILKSKMN